MPLTATYAADFASFYAAVQTAEVHLKSFEAGGNKVGAALNKAVDSFSGRKIQTEATIAQEAVERIGGVTKLTEAEQARLNRTLTEALAKYKALGMDAQAGMQKLADQTKQAEKATGSMITSVGDLVKGYLALASIQSLVSFVKGINDEASALVDLSQQTHIGIEDLQILGGAMSEFGIDSATLGKGLYNLSRKIAGEDDSVGHALHVMGMSFKDFEDMDATGTFLKIEGGLAKLQGGLRDDTSAELFGGRMGMAMAGASEGIQEAYDKTKRLSTVMSTEAAKAADEMGESIDRAERSMKAMALNIEGPFAQGMNTLVDLYSRGTTKAEIFWAMFKDANATALTGVQQTGSLTMLIDDLNRKTEAGAKADLAAAAAIAAKTDASKAHGKQLTFMEALEADAAKAVSATQRRDLAHLKELGQLNAANAQGIGVSAGMFARYTAEMEVATKAREKMIASMQKADAALVSSVAELSGTLGKIATQSTTQLEKDVNALHAIEAMIKKLDDELRPKVVTAEEQLALDLAAVGKADSAHMISYAKGQSMSNDLYESYLRGQGAAGNLPGTYLSPSGAAEGSGTSLLRPQSLASGAPINNITFNMTGLLATSDPSGKKALADAVGAALISQTRQTRTF